MFKNEKRIKKYITIFFNSPTAIVIALSIFVINLIGPVDYINKYILK